MAKIIFGPLISDARNKQGTTVFSRNQYGAFTRTLIRTPNPHSSRQAAVRAAFAAIVPRWSNTLTDAQRAGWEVIAGKTVETDQLGQVRPLTGQAYYTRINMNLWAIGLSAIDDPIPPGNVLAPLDVTAAAASAGAATLSLTPLVPPDGTVTPIVMATPLLSAGTAWFGRKLFQLVPGATGFTDLFPSSSSLANYTQHDFGGTNIWSVAAPTLTYTGTDISALIRNGFTLTDGSLSASIQDPAQAGVQGGIAFRLNPSTGAKYLAVYIPASSLLLLLYRPTWDDFSGGSLLASASFTWGTGFRTMLAAAAGPNLTVAIDGTTILTATDATLASGAVACTGYNDTTNFQTLSATTAAIPLDLAVLGPLWATKFGAMTAGKKIGLQLAYISNTTGASSSITRTLVTIGA